MPLEETDSIDMITQRGAGGRYGLLIIDEGVTADPAERLALLQRKLLSYRNAVVSGQLAETCPGTMPEDFFVQVVCELPPTMAMRKITHVLTKSKPPVEIPVVFTAFPEASWKESDLEAGETAGPVLSDEMREAVDAVFTAAAQWLAEDQLPLFVYWHEGEEKKLTSIASAKDLDEVVARVTAWAQSFGNEAHLCVQLSTVKTGESSLPADALIARCCERGEREGFVLMQDIGLETKTGTLVPKGSIRFVERCENFFPVD